MPNNTNANTMMDEQRTKNPKHAARVRLFQILCALDAENDDSLTQAEIESRFEELFVVPESGLPSEASDEDDVGRELVTFEVFRHTCAQAVAIRSSLERIDELIERYSTEWKTSRMSLVDRTAIRLAVYEGFIAKSVPVSVAVSEAVIIGKEFSGDVSGRFVNGVLARIAKAIGQ